MVEQELAVELLANLTPAIVDRELRKIGEAERELDEATAKMAKAVEDLKAEHEKGIRDKRRKVDDLCMRLVSSCKASRAAIFEGDAQTLKLGFGTVSLRQKPSRVQPREGVAEDDVLAMMRRRRMRSYYCVHYALDRAALNKAAVAGLLSDKALEKLGLEVVPGEESWTIKADQEAVREALGQP